jgi:hypothetical protein
VLERTPAGQVDRIELIRGGAPGIDMQGYAVVVNVILKTAASRQSILTWNAMLFDGGQDVYGGSYQFTATNGERSWSVLLSDGTSTSDSNGPGRNIRRDAAGALIRDEAFVNDGWGGGDSIRGNYSGPVAGGKLEATARVRRPRLAGVAGDELAPTVAPQRLCRGHQVGRAGPDLYPAAQARNGRWRPGSSTSSRTSTTSPPATRPRRPAKAPSSGSRPTATRRNRSSAPWSATSAFAALTIEAGGEVAYNMLDTKQAYSEGGVGVALPSAPRSRSRSCAARPSPRRPGGSIPS